MNKANDETVWFLDSGCSNHMSGKKKYFSNLDESYTDTVKMTNNSTMVVMRKGNIRLNRNGVTHIVTGVFFVPELRNNLLSVGQLQEKGFSILFQHGKCKVFHPESGLIMETRMASNRMFMLHLWHCRYGHLSFQGLNTL